MDLLGVLAEGKVLIVFGKPAAELDAAKQGHISLHRTENGRRFFAFLGAVVFQFKTYDVFDHNFLLAENIIMKL